MGAHAKLAPSSAHRWLECHGSVALCEQAPDRDSAYAREGTFAHEVAAKCLEQGKDAFAYLNTKSESGEFTVTEEMAGHVNAYIEFVDGLVQMWGGKPLVETKVKVSENIYGTADLILLSEDGTTLHVADFKYGQGQVVAAEGNMQALCYAIGALYAIDAVKSAAIEDVVIHIYQPRAGGEPWREWQTKRTDVLSASARLLDAEARIGAGSTMLKTGAHCKFCDASATCPARAQEANVAAEGVFNNTAPPAIETLSTEQIAKIVELTPRVEDWLKAVHDHAKRKLERGEEVPGYKLVEKVGNRRWVDKTEAEQILGMMGVNAFNKPTLISPAEAERRLATQGAKLSVSSMVERPAAGQAMVPISDKRPAADPRAVFKPER